MTRETLRAPLSNEEIQRQLERVIGSSEFRVSDRSRNFLRYIVDEALAGRADGLKAYCIAVEVFGRDETFDAQADPVVRIEAARIRWALERYYFTGGCADRVLIGIPKGGYRPTFTLRSTMEAVRDAPPQPVRAARLPRTWSSGIAMTVLVGASLLINAALWFAAPATARLNSGPQPQGIVAARLPNFLIDRDVKPVNCEQAAGS